MLLCSHGMSKTLHETNEDERARRLNAFNMWRLTPGIDVGHEMVARMEDDLRAYERAYVEEACGAIRHTAALAPTDAAGFLAWFEALEQTGPGQHDPLFAWLAERATRAEMTWFITQEIAGEAGFDDLVALTQIKMPPRAKLELARNYWDEMGQGNEGGMHGPMLERLAEELDIGKPNPDEVVWESLALANLMAGMAIHRRYAYHSVGALGVIELTAPGRATLVNAGLKRLGIGGEARRYFALHATLDVKHSHAWNREVIGPLVAADPRVAPLIAEGALVRLEAGKRCFDRYRRVLWSASRFSRHGHEDVSHLTRSRIAR